jgi:Flp pilus assembly protein TadG
MIKNRKNQTGQAGIEFMVVCVAVFFFLFFFLSMSVVYVVSEYMDYAVFMAARTYKSGFSTEAFGEQHATEIFNDYTQNVQGIARNINLQFHNNTDPNGASQTSGVSATYDMDLFYLPPLFIPADQRPVSTITLTAESHLGRDPSFTECQNFFTAFLSKFGLGLENSALEQQMEDNGC